MTLVDGLRAAALHLRGFRDRRVATSIGMVRLVEAGGRGPIPLVVALHGLGSAAVDLGRLLTCLRDVASLVVAPDLPGHGRSEPSGPRASVAAIQAGLDEALLQLASPAALLLGNSLGGTAAIRYAAAHPERVCGLALVSPAGATMPPEELRELLEYFDAGDGAGARELMRRVMPGHRFRRRLYAWGVRARLRRPQLRALVHDIVRRDLLQPSELAKLSMPILLLWGEHDRLLPRTSLRFFRKFLPEHAIIEDLEGLGHAPHLEDARLVADRVLEFWRDRVGP